MSKRRNQSRSSDPGLDKLITAAIDAEIRDPNWRARVTGGRSVEECAVNVPQRAVLRIGIGKFDYFFVTEQARKLGMKPGAFVRMCVGEWMLRHTDYDPENMEMLLRDVDRAGRE